MQNTFGTAKLSSSLKLQKKKLGQPKVHVKPFVCKNPTCIE
jgi:hypothetical protein